MIQRDPMRRRWLKASLALGGLGRGGFDAAGGAGPGPRLRFGGRAVLRPLPAIPIPYYAPPPVVYAPPPVYYAAGQPAPVYAPPRRAAPAPVAPQAQTWYYCDNPKGYYPYVSACNAGWRQVPAQPQ